MHNPFHNHRPWSQTPMFRPPPPENNVQSHHHPMYNSSFSNPPHWFPTRAFNPGFPQFSPRPEDFRQDYSSHQRLSPPNLYNPNFFNHYNNNSIPFSPGAFNNQNDWRPPSHDIVYNFRGQPSSFSNNGARGGQKRLFPPFKRTKKAAKKAALKKSILRQNNVSQANFPRSLKRAFGKVASKEPELKKLKVEVPPGPAVETFLSAYPTKTLCEKTIQEFLPDHWSIDCLADFKNSKILKKVRDDHKDLEKLQLAFGDDISHIEQVENPYLWLIFMLKSFEAKEKCKDVRLFHGTSLPNALSIVVDNFDYRLAGASRGHKYGKGVNFSNSPSFSQYFTDTGHAILARVLIGETHLGDKDTILPKDNFDSTGNNRDIFVKYHDHEFYPELLIHFVVKTIVPPF